MAALAPFFATQFFTDAGVVAAGHLLYTYESGTTVDKATFTNQAGTVPNLNPIPLDSGGRCTLWLADGEYTLVLRTPDGSLVKTWDDVAGIPVVSDEDFVPLAGGEMTGLLYLSGNATSALGAVPKQQLDASIAGVQAAVLAALDDPIPIGTVALWATGTPPSGWLELRGQSVSRTVYADLFSLWGTSFGSGDGSTTFGLPETRGEFLRFWDNTRGVDSGRGLASAQSEMIGSHTHQFSTGQGNADGNDNATNEGVLFTGVGGGGTFTSTTAANSGTENRPRNFALMAIVKAA